MPRTKEDDRLRWHERYKDPVYREKYLARKKEYLKERYKKDADFRAKCAEYKRKYREKKAMENENVNLSEAVQDLYGEPTIYEDY